MTTNEEKLQKKNEKLLKKAEKQKKKEEKKREKEERRNRKKEENDQFKIFNFDRKWQLIHSLGAAVIFGFGLVIITVFDFFCLPDKMNEFLLILGGTILVAGISSFVLQLFSSVRFFQKEIIKTFYEFFATDSKYLRAVNPAQLEKNWKILSHHLYKERFPELSNELSSLITSVYFPKDHLIYYENHRLTCSYSIIDIQNEFVKLIETTSLDVIANSENEGVDYEFERIIPKLDPYDVVTRSTLLEFTIDGKKPEIKENIDEIRGNKIYQRVKTGKFTGKKTYKVYIEHERIYSLKVNQLKTYRAYRLLNKCEVEIQYPDEMMLDFTNLGTVKKFESIGKNLKNILYERYSGLILPHQGYAVTLRLK